MGSENTHWVTDSDFLKGMYAIFLVKLREKKRKIIKILTWPSVSQISIVCNHCSAVHKSKDYNYDRVKQILKIVFKER